MLSRLSIAIPFHLPPRRSDAPRNGKSSGGRSRSIIFGPNATQIVEPMKQALTPETRETILMLKEQVVHTMERPCPSLDLYRAVFDGGVRTLGALMRWLPRHSPSGVVSWVPPVPLSPLSRSTLRSAR